MNYSLSNITSKRLITQCLPFVPSDLTQNALNSVQVMFYVFHTISEFSSDYSSYNTDTSIFLEEAHHVFCEARTGFSYALSNRISRTMHQKIRYNLKNLDIRCGAILLKYWGHALRSCLCPCSTSWKVAGFIPDDVKILSDSLWPLSGLSPNRNGYQEYFIELYI